MNATVVPFFRSLRTARDWSSQDLAEFYRVEAALIQAGISVETERGVSDEGEPWFAFCRSGDGEVVIHIARIDGAYVLVGAAYEGVARGVDLRSLVGDLVLRHPLVRPAGKRQEGSNVFLHPAALLVAVVATAFFKTSEAQASTESHDAPEGAARLGGTLPSITGGIRLSGTADSASITIDAFHTAVIVSAIVSVLDPVLRFGPVSNGDLFGSPPEPSTDGFGEVVSTHQVASSEVGYSSDAPLATHADADLASDVPNGGIAHREIPLAVDGSSAFSLLAILWDLPKLSAAMTTPVAGSTTPSAEFADAPHAAAAAGSEIATRPILSLHLSAGEWPNIEAAKIVLAGGSIIPFEIQNIQHVADLPASLANAIGGGVHNSVESLPTPAALPGELPQSVTPGSASSGPLRSFNSDAESAGAALADSQIGLQKLLANFVAHTAHYDVITTNHKIVFYDVDALTQKLPDLKSVTWDFADGSTLSLVGLPDSLPHQIA